MSELRSTPTVLCCSVQQRLHLQELVRVQRALQRTHLQSRKEARFHSAPVSGNQDHKLAIRKSRALQEHRIPPKMSISDSRSSTRPHQTGRLLVRLKDPMVIPYPGPIPSTSPSLSK